MNMNIELIFPEHIVSMNKKICAHEKQKSICLDLGKVESALAAAYYPGEHPFRYGGVASVAGALCFFLVKAHAFLDGNKRTAGISSSAFLTLNHHELLYPLNIKKGINAFASIIDDAASSKISKEDLIQWYENHKKRK